MDGLWVRLLVDEQDRLVLEASRRRIMTATSGARSIAGNRGAKTPQRVKGLATKSLAGLPADLKKGIAADVALLVAGADVGVEGGATLGVRCWSLHGNDRVSIQTSFDRRLKVRLAEAVPDSHRNPPGRVAYLARKGRHLYLVLPDAGSRPSVAMTAANGSAASPSTGRPLCAKCGSWHVRHEDPQLCDGHEWSCDPCDKYTTVVYDSPPPGRASVGS